MTDTDTFAFGKFVPGFDFMRQLAQSGAGAAAPALGIVPTVNVDELDKRIQELKAVQFWLEQNSAAVKATIQALQVQKMTLAALAGMNLNVAQMAKAFTAAPPKPAAAPAAAKPDAPQKDARPAPAAGAQAPAGPVDPLQWWGALTQQFQKIATETMREAARAAPAPAKSKDASASSAAAEKAPAKKTAAVKKAPAKKAHAKKAVAKKAAAKKAVPAPKAAGLPGWQLPPPFKLPR